MQGGKVLIVDEHTGRAMPGRRWSEGLHKAVEAKEKVSFALPSSEDGSLDISGATGGAFGTYLDMDGAAKNESDLIRKYRQMALFPEAELAIDDIVNEAVVADREQNPVNINLANINLSLDIKEKIVENFHEVVHLLNFKGLLRELGFYSINTISLSSLGKDSAQLVFASKFICFTRTNIINTPSKSG